MGTISETPTWPEITAYFTALGFVVRAENVGALARRCQPTGTWQFIQRNTAGFEPADMWVATLDGPRRMESWRSPWFPDPISAFVHAEIENWGRP